MEISRRSLLVGGVGLATTAASLRATASAAQRGPTALTAARVIDRIKANVGIPWRTQTVDNIVAGAPDTPVTGIASVMMATFDVLQRSIAAGKNMVITHESTFFTHQDRTDNIAEDEVYRAKRELIRSHEMVVFHFHDHWHGRRPDGIATGMIRELGWEQNADPQNAREFVFPATPLAAWAKNIESRLNIRTLRVVGDPNLPIRRALASWGNVSLMPGIPFLARPDVDALILGETHEWELMEYAMGSITSGNKKALVMLGHMISEQAGMKYCADWLRSFISEVPVEFVAMPEPYWRPDDRIG